MFGREAAADLGLGDPGDDLGDDDFTECSPEVLLDKSAEDFDVGRSFTLDIEFKLVNTGPDML